MVGLTFGENTEDKVVQDLMDLTKSWGLRYMGLKWKNSSPWYDYANLRYLPVRLRRLLPPGDCGR